MLIVQAIETTYLSPTNCRGGRIKARAWAGSATIPYPHELSHEQAHRKAAMALVEKMGWENAHWFQGGNARGDGYVFVRGESV